MAFLGGTFFPVDRLPEWTQAILYILPITYSSSIIRSSALDNEIGIVPVIVLFGMFGGLFTIATSLVKRARDWLKRGYPFGDYLRFC